MLRLETMTTPIIGSYKSKRWIGAYKEADLGWVVMIPYNIAGIRFSSTSASKRMAPEAAMGARQ